MSWKFGNKVYRNLEEQVLKNKQDAEALAKEQSKIIRGDYSVIKPSRGAPDGYTPQNAGEMESCAAYSDNSLALGNETLAGQELFVIELGSITVENQADGYHLFIGELNEEVVEIAYFRIAAPGYTDNQIYFRGTYDYNVGILLPNNVTEAIANSIYDEDQGPIVYIERIGNVGGDYAKSSGYGSIASGFASTAEGGESIANDTRSHAEGSRTVALAFGSHAEGVHTVVYPNALFGHAEGGLTKVYGERAHAEGSLTIARAPYSHAEGNTSESSGNASHAEGHRTFASGWGAHSEGITTTANGQSAHAEGSNTTASGEGAHAEGRSTKATGVYSHAEGHGATADAQGAHAEGFSTTASGRYSHTEGYQTKTTAQSSHAGGELSEAIALGSFVHGNGLKSDRAYQTVVGKYNAPTSGSAEEMFVVGCGSSVARKNIFISGKILNGDSYITIGDTTITESQLQSLLSLI